MNGLQDKMNTLIPLDPIPFLWLLRQRGETSSLAPMSTKETFDCIVPSNPVLRCEGELQIVVRKRGNCVMWGWYLLDRWLIQFCMPPSIRYLTGWEFETSIDFLKVKRAWSRPKFVEHVRKCRWSSSTAKQRGQSFRDSVLTGKASEGWTIEEAAFQGSDRSWSHIAAEP